MNDVIDLFDPIGPLTTIQKEVPIAWKNKTLLFLGKPLWERLNRLFDLYFKHELNVGKTRFRMTDDNRREQYKIEGQPIYLVYDVYNNQFLYGWKIVDDDVEWIEEIRFIINEDESYNQTGKTTFRNNRTATDAMKETRRGVVIF